MVTWVIGTKSTRTSGSPRAVRRIWSPSKTVQQQKSQAQCWQPLAYGQRPLTR